MSQTTGSTRGSVDAARYEGAAEQCAELYRPAGRFTHGYVRGKLLRDPVYRQLAECAPHGDPVVDLGCGRGQTGILLGLLFPELRVSGFDWDESKLALARKVSRTAGLSERLSFDSGDLRDLDYPEARTILMLDVLHYNPIEVQDAMLRRACSKLAPGGRLFLREVDADGGWRARATIWQERLGCWTGFNRGQTLEFRSAQSIVAVLEACGLSTHCSASFEGTPLANVLIEGRARGFGA